MLKHYVAEVTTVQAVDEGAEDEWENIIII